MGGPPPPQFLLEGALPWRRVVPRRVARMARRGLWAPGHQICWPGPPAHGGPEGPLGPLIPLADGRARRPRAGPREGPLGRRAGHLGPEAA
eukprot:9494435-Pyramimonas_sp.AAC.1